MNRRAKLFPFLAAPLAALISSQAFGAPILVWGPVAALEDNYATAIVGALGSSPGAAETSLLYVWESAGNPPGYVTFTPARKTNAAKNSRASFMKAGEYDLRVTVFDPVVGGSVNGTVHLSVPARPTRIVVSPDHMSMSANYSQQLKARVKDQFGDDLEPQPAISWSASPGASVSATGLFAAGPAARADHVVTVAASGLTGTASIRVDGTRVVNAASYPGADLGAKINAADADLSAARGAVRGEIQVYGGGTIATQVVLSSSHTLRLFAGDYYSAMPSHAPAFLMKSHSRILGTGWDTILYESQADYGYRVIGNYLNGFVVSSNSQDLNADGDHDLVVGHLQIRGRNSGFDSAAATVNMGNSHGVVVADVWLNKTRTIGIQAGAFDYHATDVWYVNNRFTGVASQNYGIVNAERVTIADNLFIDPGQPGGPGVCTIDFEPNTPENWMNDNLITRNREVSYGNPMGQPHGNFLCYQPGAAGGISQLDGPSYVVENSAFSAVVNPNIPEQLSSIQVVNCLFIFGSHNGVFASNYFDGCGQSGASVTGGSDNSIHHNTFINTGTGGVESFVVGGSQRNQIYSNSITAPHLGVERIVETSSADYNSYALNDVRGGITLTGAHSEILPNGPAPADPIVPKTAAPSISPAGGYIEASSPITLATATPFSRIHYTIDGAEPTLLSPLYTSPFTLASSARVKARAYRGGQLESNISEASFSRNMIDHQRFFVAQHYRDFLEREGDTAGLDYWTSHITACGSNATCLDQKRIDVSRAFWYASEFLQMHPGLRNPPGISPDFDNREFVRLCYVVYLQRDPDQAGWDYWTNELNNDIFNGVGYDHLIKAFLVSSDYRGRFGG